MNFLSLRLLEKGRRVVERGGCWRPPCAPPAAWFAWSAPSEPAALVRFASLTSLASLSPPSLQEEEDMRRKGKEEDEERKKGRNDSGPVIKYLKTNIITQEKQQQIWNRALEYIKDQLFSSFNRTNVKGLLVNGECARGPWAYFPFVCCALSFSCPLVALLLSSSSLPLLVVVDGLCAVRS